MSLGRNSERVRRRHQMNFMELELLTDRLLLRPLGLDDLDLTTKMFTDPEVVRYVGGLQQKIQTRACQMRHTSRRQTTCIW